ncbi:MAG: DnaB-like helicase C-terminal domain-containing protein [Sterolibacterium sp.]
MTEGLSDLNLELALLGSIVTNNDTLAYLSFLTPDHFHSRFHAEIYRVMVDLHERGTPITPFTLKLSPEDEQKFERNGGLKDYLIQAVKASMSIINPVEHAKLVLGYHTAREASSLLETALLSVNDPSDGITVDEKLAVLKSGLDKLVLRNGLPDAHTSYDVTLAILERLKTNPLPTSTGIQTLDEAMGGGLYPSRAYGFAARKKVGKTILVATISHNLNKQKKKHLVICGEMGEEQVHERVLARETESFPSAFLGEYGRTLGFQTKVALAARSDNRCAFYHDAPGLTFSDLKRICSHYVIRENVEGIILDYWQLVGGKEKGQSDAAHLDEVAQWLASFGKKHKIWIIAMAQINQEGNTRGGEGIRLAFDQVYEIHREDITAPEVWVEMRDTRYTAWANIGDKDNAGWIMEAKGPYFRDA